jgi:hypothetical protein
MAILVSPGVNTSEIDLTSSVPAVGTSTGATAGVFRWGPANTVVQVTGESDLLQRFFKPDSVTAASFLSAANFLAYGNDLLLVRAIHGAGDADSSNNALSNVSHYVTIPNDESYLSSQYLTSNTVVQWAARYPGKVGNSLAVHVCPSAAAFTGWQFSSYFDSAPGTSNFVKSAAGGTLLNDEMHVVVVDESGQFTGTANTVLERYPYVSKATDAKDDTGTAIYYKEAVTRNSKYIHWMGHAVGAGVANAWGQTVATVLDAGQTFHSPAANVAYSFGGGTDGVLHTADVVGAFSVFDNKESYDLSLVFMGEAGQSSNATIGASAAWTTISNEINRIVELRQDCVGFISPPYANAVTSSDKAADIVSFRNGVTSSSYLVMDSGWKYQYDKYNDVYRWIPLSPDIAGLCVRTDATRDPWFSPAGLNRGQIRNIIKLGFNPSPAQRDTLYKNGVNPVVSFPGEGALLYGDKTLQGRSSAFDRINVRRLFIVLEKAIAKAARASLFEFNDEFTRSQFVALIEPFLRDIQGRRGIYDFRVVCDETNNPASVIDANQFVGDIYVKPARSINFIQLNFVAVRSGVAFDEIVGRF